MIDALEGLNCAQKEAVLATEGPVLIVAGAGAGKTKTLTHRIGHIIEKGVPGEAILAITFTNKAAKEMRDRVLRLLGRSGGAPVWGHRKGVPWIGTFHGLGAFILREKGELIGIPRSATILDQDDSLKLIKRAMQKAGVDPKQFEPRRIQSLISRHKGNMGKAEDIEKMTENHYLAQVLARVFVLYETALREAKVLDFDDLLEKTVRLLETNEDARRYYQAQWKYIHVDEYQDTNKVQYHLIRLLAGTSQNICVVGDSDQCLVEGTKITLANGKLLPIEKIKKGDEVLSNYGSGDCRPASVEAVFKRNYSGELIRIELEDGSTLTSTPEHVHFAAYRLGISPQYYFTYLMWKRGMGFRLGVSQVYTNGQKRPMVGFRQRLNHEHADKIWIIAAQKNMNAARVLEYELSLKYQIPTLPFVARKGSSINGYVHDQELINSIFSKFDTEKTANMLLRNYGLSEHHPHWLPQSKNSNRRNVTITLCGDGRGKNPLHRIAMVGNDDKGREVLRSLGFSVRPAKQGSMSWRFETAHADYKRLMEIVEMVDNAFGGVNVIRNARLGKQQTKDLVENNSLPFLPASSILPCMSMFNGKGEYITVASVERLKGVKTRVYDLNVTRTHNFIANNIITHNSIYSWRGASIANILEFEEDFSGAKVILLEENYRSTQSILTAANTVIAKNTMRKEKNLFTKNGNGEKLALFGAYDENDEAQYVISRVVSLQKDGARRSEMAVLYRTNFQSRALEEAFLYAGIPYQVLGVRFYERKEVKDTIAYLRAALNPHSTLDIERIINVPARGVGKVTLQKILSGQKGSLPATMRAKVDTFFALLKRIREVAEKLPPSKLIAFIIKETGIEKMYSDGDDEDNERLANIKELVSVATRYDPIEGKEGIEQFLADIALESDQDTMKSEHDAVRLMTVHAAKGLEFHYVFVTGMEQDLFPSRRSQDESKDISEREEERRLFYVALTRAAKRVFLSYASFRTIFGQRQVNIPSEFIGDIDDALIEHHTREGETSEGKPKRKVSLLGWGDDDWDKEGSDDETVVYL